MGVLQPLANTVTIGKGGGGGPRRRREIEFISDCTNSSCERRVGEERSEIFVDICICRLRVVST